MTLYETIIKAYPELLDKPEEFGAGGSILLQDDSDGNGPYIVKWDYAEALPKGMKLGK